MSAIYMKAKGVMDVLKPEPLRVGLDVVLVSRVEQMYNKRPRQFVQRFFGEDEREYCLAPSRPACRFQRFAGRIAAKEAVMKVLRQGWPRLSWTDIQIVSDGSGRPVVELRGKALEIMDRLGLASIQVSITHDGDIAAAVAVGISRMVDSDGLN